LTNTAEPVKRRRNRGPVVPRDLDKPLVLTFTEACHELGDISRRTLRRIIKSGELAVTRVADHEGIAYGELVDYVARNTRRAQAE
jgi:hypothetical protein